MANELTVIFGRCARQRRIFPPARSRLHLRDHVSAVVGRCISILAVVGFLSFASPVFASVRSGHMRE